MSTQQPPDYTPEAQNALARGMLAKQAEYLPILDGPHAGFLAPVARGQDAIRIPLPVDPLVGGGVEVTTYLRQRIGFRDADGTVEWFWFYAERTLKPTEVMPALLALARLPKLWDGPRRKVSAVFEALGRGDVQHQHFYRCVRSLALAEGYTVQAWRPQYDFTSEEADRG